MSNTKKTDETETRPTLAEETGLTMSDALAAIRELTAKFDAQNEETAKLRNTVVAQSAQLEVINAKGKASKFGAVEIQQRICNNCGAAVSPGVRCTKHPRGKVNEIGMGTKHNRMQPIIVRQV